MNVIMDMILDILLTFVMVLCVLVVGLGSALVAERAKAEECNGKQRFINKYTCCTDSNGDAKLF